MTNLERLRLAHGLTQETVSGVVGIAVSTYSMYENGKREEMERRDVSLEQAVRNFCIRVLEGNGHPQEVAILPQMLQYVMGHDPEVESRQNELAAKVN